MFVPRREATFSWLDGWTQLVDERTERSRGMTLELSNWFYEGVLMKGGVLAIDRAYFNITGGRERWLYKVARKHGGGAGEGGFAISMPTLFEKSGTEGEYRRFKFEMLKLAEKNALPGYDLRVEAAKEGAEPSLRMRRNDAKGQGLILTSVDRSAQPAGQGAETDDSAKKVSSRKLSDAAAREPLIDAGTLIRHSLNTLSDTATRGFVTSDTIAFLRTECPGWDLYALHAEFETWANASPERTPANWQKAFIGWVRRHHDKHKHELRR